MKKVAYLTMQDDRDFVTDFSLSVAPMAALGWEVEPVAWRSGRDWNHFDAVYICAPWDYPQHLGEFEQMLDAIEASSAILFNDIETVRWNLGKTYLRDLDARGHDTVPSLWYDDFQASSVPGFFRALETHRVVIKPVVGGNARDTFVLDDPVDSEQLTTLRRLFADRQFLVQRFIENIQLDGEYSLFFFNGEYSHAIRKVPKTGDFRVQEEHGADITAVTPDTVLLETARGVISQLEPLPVYARGDWVRGSDGCFLLMELELVEPSLYLRTNRDAAGRFAAAVDQRFEEFSGK